MKVAYLGPKGTYSALALAQYFPDADPHPCNTITQVFELLSTSKVDAGFVPKENLVQGPVTETLDCLLQFQKQIGIYDSYEMQIEHALGQFPVAGANAVTANEIHVVYSHQQALEQSSSYLRKKLPNAKLVAVESTAAAVELVRQSKKNDAAVIGAAETLKENGFTIIEQSLLSDARNETRFVLLLRHSDISAQSKLDAHARNIATASATQADRKFITSFLIAPGRDRKGLLYEILGIVSAKYGLNMCSIHSRPDKAGGFTFHLDIEGRRGEAAVDECLVELDRFCKESTGEVAEISVFGSYPFYPFERSNFSKVCVVGGEGAMGQWFVKFFSDCGLEVSTVDKGDGKKLGKALGAADVVLLSVPMSTFDEVVAAVLPHLRAGQLVVENCSIKSVSLPKLVSVIPSGIEVLGIHTMFGPSCNTLRGQNILITKSDSSGAIAKSFENLFYKHGAILSHASIAEHDHMAAMFQSLLHVVFISLAEVFRDNFSEEESYAAFSTPNSRELFKAMGRVLNQSDELISDMQVLNSKALELRRRYIESLFRMVFDLEYQQLNSLLQSAKDSREFFAKRLAELI